MDRHPGDISSQLLAAQDHESSLDQVLPSYSELVGSLRRAAGVGPGLRVESGACLDWDSGHECVHRDRAQIIQKQQKKFTNNTEKTIHK